VGLKKTMDSLINALENFTVKENFESELDNIVKKLDSTALEEECDREWEDLSINYSRMLYLRKLIIKHNPNHPSFFKCLSYFLTQMDTKSQYYLKEITWYDDPDFDDEYHQECQTIKLNLENSLNTSNQLVKLNYILNAYDILVPIIEEFRKERVEINVDDDFKRDFKKRKIN
jgi:hypothetical protein